MKIIFFTWLILIVSACDSGSSNNNPSPDNEVNSLPVFLTDNLLQLAVEEGELLEFFLEAADRDGDELKYGVGDAPEGLSLDSASGLVTWTPNFRQSGTYNLTFSVTDLQNQDQQSLQTVDIILKVNEVNRAAEFVEKEPIRLTLIENTSLSYSLNATDLDDDPVEYSLINPIGNMRIDHLGLLTWTPSYQESGEYLIEITVSDGKQVQPSSKTMEILVENVNRRPVVVSQVDPILASVHHSSSYQIQADDPDDEPLDYSIVGTPLAGMSLDRTTGQIVFMPDKPLIGSHQVIVVVTDGEFSEQVVLTFQVILEFDWLKVPDSSNIYRFTPWNDDLVAHHVNDKLSIGYQLEIVDGCDDWNPLPAIDFYSGKVSGVPASLGDCQVTTEALAFSGLPRSILNTSNHEGGLEIPDPGMIVDTLDIATEGKISEKFAVEIYIQHRFIGDLRVTLIAPDGTPVVLHSRTGLGKDDIKGTYPEDLQPVDSFDLLKGRELFGQWQLVVADEDSLLSGKLISWSIIDETISIEDSIARNINLKVEDDFPEGWQGNSFNGNNFWDITVSQGRGEADND